MDNILKERSFEFAIRIVKLVKYLQEEKKEFVLSKQLLRSGTAIGALVSEAQFGQSRADFLSKLYIALKEANESVYWIELLHATEYLNESQFQSINADSKGILALLISITKTIKQKNEKK
jgi:TIGR02436 family protein